MSRPEGDPVGDGGESVGEVDTVVRAERGVRIGDGRDAVRPEVAAGEEPATGDGCRATLHVEIRVREEEVRIDVARRLRTRGTRWRCGGRTGGGSEEDGNGEQHRTVTAAHATHALMSHDSHRSTPIHAGRSHRTPIEDRPVAMPVRGDARTIRASRPTVKKRRAREPTGRSVPPVIPCPAPRRARQSRAPRPRRRPGARSGHGPGWSASA